ncbi:hypothetical protein GCM10009839_03840 [Catenulispora yoronensis]|uniref:Secreted protein n=1 Tax=Catenulispora yoronensis TaxID=450799 RepID=A0ABP5F360_9ACTN
MVIHGAAAALPEAVAGPVAAAASRQAPAETDSMAATAARWRARRRVVTLSWRSMRPFKRRISFGNPLVGRDAADYSGHSSFRPHRMRPPGTRPPKL